MGKIIYNDRGIARGVDLGFSPMAALKKSINPTKKNSDAIRDTVKTASRVNVNVKNKPRKNGVYQGPSVKFSMDEDNSPNDKDDKKSTEGDRYAASLEKKGAAQKAVDKKKIQKAADRKTRVDSLKRIQNTPGVERERLEKTRQERIKNKDYKGKYYGPDEFKGNLDKLRKWRAAGSPKDTSKFAKG